MRPSIRGVVLRALLANPLGLTRSELVDATGLTYAQVSNALGYGAIGWMLSGGGNGAPWCLKTECRGQALYYAKRSGVEPMLSANAQAAARAHSVWPRGLLPSAVGVAEILSIEREEL